MSALTQKILYKLATAKYFLAFDIFERHKFIGTFIPDGAEILDVGGSLSQLHYFSKPKKIMTIDIKPPADIVYDGDKIPAKENSFDIITSIDVFEHVPRPARDNFIAELNRVAKNKIILSAPLGTKTHIKYETEALAYAKKHGIDMPYIEEHIANGLPTPEEIADYAKQYNGKVYYSGNLPLNEKLFKLHTFEVRNPYLNIIVFMLKLIVNAVANITLYNYMVKRPLNENINRFYLIIEK